jgi:hypothetical protein
MGQGWLMKAGRRGDVLVARDVVGPVELLGRRDDGTFEDPVAAAARMAGRQLGRDEISRDDLIAHLTLGFWVVRVPGGFGVNRVFDVVAASLGSPLHDGVALRHVMVDHVLRTRNRVAHHEPLLFRAKHVLTRSGVPKTGADLAVSLLGAIDTLVEEVRLTVLTARTLAPIVAPRLERVQPQVESRVSGLAQRLVEERDRIRSARDARRAARRQAECTTADRPSDAD